MSNKDMIDEEGKLKAKAGPKHDRIGRWLDRAYTEREREMKTKRDPQRTSPRWASGQSAGGTGAVKGSGSCACIC